ncbi:heme biosynthesis protein HemY [Thiohalophilus sp.]|uniref:heme biosynthesis protein HemY n=1 Tax=Thiohalophilus sp. TaxID=3028392 RepID=UPI002ACDC563|nr:heme biosynthesis protein HemY [Thiohalophilus sp.]MDZ7661445.1 heme biosynthesis protein HemY [Thiohalophilus sp.]
MKWLFYAFLILLGGVLLGLLAYQDPGYVLISRGEHTVEMTLSLFVSAIVIGFIVLYMLIRTVVRSWHVPARWRRWRKLRRRRKARQSSNRGLIELAEGNWRRAERALIKHVRESDTPLLNYLSAARAAQKQHAHERRDHYLSLAHNSAPGADIAVELTQAELQLAHGQLEQSLASLMHLQSLAPHHPHVLYLLVQLYEQLHSWGDLQVLLPQLDKYKVLSESEHDQLSKKVYLNLLQMNQHKAESLNNIWQQMPRDLRHDHALIEEYARHLIDLAQHDTAEAILRDAIKRDYNSELVRLYGLAKSSTPERQLQQAEHWLKGRENNANLLLTLGRLARRCELWGKARSYLEASLGNHELAETYRELGQLLDKLNEREQAAEYYRKGLLLGV